MQKTKSYEGNWQSERLTTIPNYNSNFSNWTDSMPTLGQIKMSIAQDKLQHLSCAIHIPTTCSGEFGHFTLIKGRMEITKSQFFIFQNENHPIILPYQQSAKKGIFIKIFERTIFFKKETSPVV